MIARRRAVFAALAALVSVVILDVSISVLFLMDGEFLGHQLAPFGAVRDDAQREWLARQQRELGQASKDETREYDVELGWRNVAGSATAAADPVRYSYDAHGARGRRERTHTPKPGVTRVTCFGDSFTHGDEVADDDTWLAQVSDLTPRIETLNYGTGAYGTDQALLALRRFGLRGAQVGCMGFMVENIGRNVNRYRPWWYPRSVALGVKPRFVLEGDELRLVPIPYRTRAEFLAAIERGDVVDDLAPADHWSREASMEWVRWSSLARLLTTWRAVARRNVERMYAARDAEPYRVTLAILESFVREAKAAGAERALVVVFPRRRDLLAMTSGTVERYWQPLVNDLRARGVEVLDITSAVVDAALDERGLSRMESLFLVGHFTPEGNRIVARAFVDQLLHSGDMASR